jgi:hypothetical protein
MSANIESAPQADKQSKGKPRYFLRTAAANIPFSEISAATEAPATFEYSAGRNK